jgi:hypothetical protein
MLKICVGIPSGRFWEAEFGQSLGLLSAAFMAHDPGRETSFHIVNVRSSLLPVGRSRIVHEALANGATHILWLDSDMMVPPDTLTRLLAHDLPVVACNYVRKEIPASPTARALDGRRLATLAGSTGLERVRHAGMG